MGSIHGKSDFKSGARKHRDLARPPKTRPVDPRGALHSHDQLLALQKLAGNSAVGRLISTSTFVAGGDHPMERRAEQAERGAGLRTAGGAQRRTSPLATGGGTGLSPLQAARAGVSPEAAAAVRVHRGPDADAMNDALGSEAFTHGSDIFVSSQYYRPGTASGNALIAHELSHATGAAASTGGIFMKRQKKHLDFVRFKRKQTHIARMLTAMALRKVGASGLAEKVDTDKEGRDIDHYGHWWVEVGSLDQVSGKWSPAESYGWWPESGVGIAETLKIKRVEGLLNQGMGKDPHHGEKADTEFHPVMEVDDKEPYEAVRDRVAKEVRDFAKAFKGSWNWRLAWGKNCHTFQDRMKKALGLHHQSAKEWLRGEGVVGPKPKTGFTKIHDEFNAMGLLGGGYGMLNASRDYFRGKLTADEVTMLTQDQRRQLVEEINKGQDGWNQARVSDLNDFFREATGTPIDFFSETDMPEGTESQTTTPTEGPGSVTVPTGSQETGDEVKGAQPTGARTSGTEGTNGVGHRVEEIDVSRLRSFDKDVVTLKTPLPAGSNLIPAGEQLYVTRVTPDNKVQVNRGQDVGGGLFWVDAAAFLAAVEENWGTSANTEVRLPSGSGLDTVGSTV